MLIFLDTNIFYNNWHLKNAQWNLLSNFISNTSALLCCSTLVCQEVQNKQESEAMEAVDAMKAELNKLDKLNPSKTSFDPKTFIQPYNFKAKLEEKFESPLYIEYGMISQEKVVHRALKQIRPFQKEDKGYRDTLIWLSLLNYLKETNNKQEVIFINANNNDFYNKQNGFHEDLLQDIKGHALTCEFNTYNSLYEFLSKRVVNDEHAVNYEEFYQQYLNNSDTLIENEIADYLEFMPLPEFSKLFTKENGDRPELIYSTDHFFEIVEGIEDPELLACKKVSKNIFYIGYKFNLRIAEISFTIPEAEYEKYRSSINHDYVSVEIMDHGVELRNFYRIDLMTTFNLDIDNMIIDGFTIDYFKYRSKL